MWQVVCEFGAVFVTGTIALTYLATLGNRRQQVRSNR